MSFVLEDFVNVSIVGVLHIVEVQSCSFALVFLILPERSQTPLCTSVLVLVRHGLSFCHSSELVAEFWTPSRTSAPVLPETEFGSNSGFTETFEAPESKEEACLQSSVFEASPLKWRVSLPSYLFRIPRLKHWCFYILGDQFLWSFPPSVWRWTPMFLQVCTWEFRTISFPRLGLGMSSVLARISPRKSWHVRNLKYNTRISSLSPFDVTEPHEDDSILKIFRFKVAMFLDLLARLVLHQSQLLLCKNWTIEILQRNFPIFHSLLNDPTYFWNRRRNLSRRARLLSSRKSRGRAQV